MHTLSDAPRLVMSPRPWGYTAAVVLTIALGVLCGIVAHGDIVSWRMPPERAGFFLVILSLSAVLLIYKATRINFKKPFITISPQGIELQAISEAIPWTSVEKVEESSSGGYKTKWLHVLLKEDTKPESLAELSAWNDRLMPRSIIFPLNGFDGFSASDVEAIIYRYFREFGRNTVDPEIRA